jgi:hypothetical protein
MNNPIELYNALHSNPHFKATRFNRVKTKLTAEKSSLHDNLADKIAREIILLNSDTLSVAKFSSKKTCTIPLAKNYSGTVNNSCMFGKFVIPLTY